MSGVSLLDLDNDGGVGSDDMPLRTKVRVLELQHTDTHIYQREKRRDEHPTPTTPRERREGFSSL